MGRTGDIAATKAFGAQVDFGRAAFDYRQHRAGFPDRFFDELAGQIDLSAGVAALDIGTGTGTVARGLARRGCTVVGIDPAPALLDQAIEIDHEEPLGIAYRDGRAEALDFEGDSFDVVTAGQCWHWFDRTRAAAEAFRVLRPGGALIIAHFDWIPLPGNVVADTEKLILEANPAWTMGGGTGLYPQWLADLSQAGFTELKTCSFDVVQPYSHEAWRGRIRASAGIKASLDPAATDEFDVRLRAMLNANYPDDPLQVPHRVWWAMGTRVAEHLPPS